MNNTLLTNTPKILGVTYVTSMTFKHATNIKNQASPRLNGIKLLANTFEHNKETTTTAYNTYNQ